MQDAPPDSTADRVLQNLAQRTMRRNLQSNMQTALEAMGLLEDSATPLSNPPAAPRPGTATANTSQGGPAGRGNPQRGRSEQLASGDTQPDQAPDRPSLSAPGTSRAGFGSAEMVARAAAAVAALDGDHFGGVPSQPARGPLPDALQPGATTTAPLAIGSCSVLSTGIPIHAEVG